MSRQIEEVERSCLRLVVTAIRDYHKEAIKIFREETDLAIPLSGSLGSATDDR